MKRSLLVAVMLACSAGVAFAHPVPKSADPRPNAVLKVGPSQIRIGFSEGLVLVFSGMEIDGPDGKAVAAGTASLDPADNKVLVVPLHVKLAPGTYLVKWHAVGDDTHHVSGHYSFQVAP